MCVKDLIFHKLMFYLQLQDPKKWLDDAEIVKFPYNIFSGITYINKGASGQVYRAKWKSDMDVALKEIMKKTKKDDGEVMKQFVHEFRSHNQVDGHENILNIYGITQNPKSGNYSLVLQFANHGTLHEYLSANVDKLDWTKKLGLAYQLASGIQALHSKGIIHRDLHAGNVLIVDDNIKISDFGLSKSREKVYGKIRYTDPRCLEHPKNEKSDIFSLGILLWQISSCKPPYEWIENDQDVYLSGERETKVDGTPEEYFDLCTRCWDSDPDNRPDIKSVVEYLDKLREQHYTVPTIIQKSTNEHLQNASTDCNHSSGAYHDFKFNDLMNEQDLLMKQNMGNTSNSDQYISDSNTNNNNNNDDIINIFNVNSFDNSRSDNLTELTKFIRNEQSKTCLQYASNSTQSCTSIILTSCPVDRFGEISDLTKWNLISTNPSQPLSNSTEIFIESLDNKLCLTTKSNSAVQACPCDNGVTQKWKLNSDDTFTSSSNNGKCLTMLADNLGLDTCQNNSTPMSWKTYNVAPNAVNIYINPLFSGNTTQLVVDQYTSKTLPTSIFKSPFSLEIPPGFLFEIDSGKSDPIIYDSDIAQADPIKSLTSTIIVKLKSGVVIYEQPAYFGNSEFFEVGASETTTQTKAIMIGSVMVPDGFRGVVWQSSNFSGTNLGLFEPVANFTGVSVATNQAPAGSFDISSASCTNECGSGGFCNEKKTCVCKNGFTGEKCDQCLPGFFGPNCQACQTSCGDPTKFTCEDGLSGSGACKCKDGFTGEKCDQCLPGFFGTNCQACNCGNGTCDDKGACSCNAGWANDPNDPKKLCSTCDIGFFASGEDCKVCSSGCNSCEAQTGKCTVCKPSLALSTDDATKCVPAANSCTAGQYFDSASQLCQPCNTQCQTCYGPGPGDCLKCLPPLSYFNGGCLPQKPTNDGKCQLNVATQQAFFIDNSQGACEACPSSCTDCSIQGYTPQSPKESMTCSKCMPGFVLDNGKCVKTCSSNKFADKDMTCKDCNSACKSCSGPLENQCLSCSNSANFAINGVCSPTPCPSSYVSLNTTCTKCHPDCAECSGPGINQCTKCPSNRPVLTKDGQCIEVCPMGTYLDSTGKCQQCNKKCSSCVGPDADQCLGCSNQSNVLIDGSCNSSCPPGTKLIKSERLCQNEENNQLVPPQPAANSGNDTAQEKKGLEWWHILIIILSIIIFLVGMVLLIRYLAVKRRKKQTDEFKEALDENHVKKQVRNLYEIAPRLLKKKKNKSHRNSQLAELEPAYSTNPKEFKQIDIDVDGSIGNYNATTSQIFNTPPPYDSKAGEMYWKNNEYVLKRAPPTTGQTVANDVYYNGGSSGTNESNSENWNGKIDRKSSNWGDNWI
ncbi:2106_t:CDS:10 [Entrophospora sp. SA101]|nr:2106_t:CDS:10 [Entrophospora sp. SA101]